MAPAQSALELDARDSHRQYDELRDLLQEVVSDFADEWEVGPQVLARLLVDLGVTSHMAGYVLSTERPSGLGLKLEIDRFQREIEDSMQSAKKDAEKIVTSAKEVLDHPG